VGRQSIELSEAVKEGLDEMASTFGMTQNALINLAVTTMVEKYKVEGVRIFFDLISPPTQTKSKK
jgi:predicted transcriptional regulator